MAVKRTPVVITLRVFMSYSHHDRRVAGQIKSELEPYGLQVFMAHEDIEPTQEWQDEILGELRRCDIFLPVLTTHFAESSWTDQEVGIAIALDKLIVPLRLQIAPYGFIGRYQALRFDSSMPFTVSESCQRIVGVIAKHPVTANIFPDCLIEAFLQSHSYKEANRKSELVWEYRPFNKEQLDRIVSGSAENGQIYHAHDAKRVVRNLIAANRRDIVAQALEAFEEKTTEAY